MGVPSKATSLSSPSVRNKVLMLAWPAIIDRFLHMSVNMVDTAMVGRLGASALAAAGLGAQIMMIATSLFASITTGTTALVARCTGAVEYEEANKVARQSLVLGGGLALVASLFFVFLANPLVKVLFPKAAPDVLAGAAIYVRIVGLGVIPQFLFVMSNAALRGAGDTKTPMFTTGVTNISNVICNYLLIFGAAGFPRLGLLGAAISTTVAHFLGASVALSALYSGKKAVHLRLRDDYRPDVETLRRILNISIPAGMEQGVIRVGQMAFTMILSSLGTVAFASHRIALQTENLSFIAGAGFALAATSLVGQALGAGDPKEAERVGLEAARIAACIMGFMGLLFLLFPRALVSIFTTDPEVIDHSTVVIRIVAISQPFMAFQRVLSGALRGAGDTRSVMIISLLGICGIRLILAHWLVTLGYGLVGAWVAMSIDLTVRGCLLYWRFRHGSWKKVVV
ncbi:MAG: MATE family efflux transporter [Firmicutes bacterium]|jgi:putative MATE family efflux protein|nr:MATE family efflux transporter [Bacillota bacterium]